MLRKPISRVARMATISAAALCATALAGPVAANAQSLQGVAISPNNSAFTLVLDVSGGSTRAGANVIQYYGNGGSNQRWNFVQLADGNEQIVSQKSGMCLTTSGVAGQQLYQWYCNGDPRQEWSGSIASVFDSGDGGYLQNPYSNLVVDINQGSWSAGAAVIGWYKNYSANQRFKYYQLG
jgi:hypothetical protein